MARGRGAGAAGGGANDMTGAEGGASGATGPVGGRMDGDTGGAIGAAGRAPGSGTPAAGKPIIVRPTGGAAGRGGIEGLGAGAIGPG
jgi:hypothetical protein